MKHITLSAVSSILLGLTNAAAVNVPKSDAPLMSEKYNFEPVEWNFDTKNGHLFFKGTIEEVRDQIKKEDPALLDELLEPETSPAVTTRDVFKRTDFSGAYFVCNKWRTANARMIYNGINYLRGVKGQPTRGPGPSSCGRVSCSNNAAINWCNDTRDQKTLASFGSIADGTLYAVQRCLRYNDIAGQAFHHTGWNVIVGWDNC